MYHFFQKNMTFDWGFGGGVGDIPTGSVTPRWYSGDPDNLDGSMFNNPDWTKSGINLGPISISQKDDNDPSGRHIGLTIGVGKSGLGIHTSNSKEILRNY